jgi:hypothetical protein
MPRRFLVGAPVAVSAAVSIALFGAGSAFAATAPGLPPAPAPVGGLIDQLVAAAQRTLTPAPAPPPSSSASNPASGSASADAVNLGPLDSCVSCTSAQAAPDDSTADSQSLRLRGQSVSSGKASGTSANNGALVALPANPLLGLMIADWMTKTDPGSTHSTSDARSAFVDASLADGRVAKVAVLEATSTAVWDGASGSGGSAATNGMTANAGQGALVVILLHSDASSSSPPDAYVASINGNKILTAQQTGRIAVDIPGQGTIHLLGTQASGRSGSASSGGVAANGATQGRAGVGSTASSGAPAESRSAAGTRGSQTGTGAGAGTRGPQAALEGSANPVTAAGDSLIAPAAGVAIGITGILLILGGIVVVTTASRRRPAVARADIPSSTPPGAS